jgi:CRP/FNR family transcriptional regulator, cyclic AMP receptor protein
MEPELDRGWPEPAVRVALLQAAPGLGSELTAAERRKAAEGLRTTVLRAPAGHRLLTIPPDLVGLLVTQGLLMVRLRVGGYTSTLILGPGDMVCACDIDAPQGSMPENRGVVGLTSVELAAVDHRLLRACLRWPTVGRALLECLTQRLRVGTLSLAVHQSPRVEERLWLAMWQLADRFGRVSPHGTAITLPGVTHSVLAEIVAARRPSVTSGMKRLGDCGLIEVTGRQRWLLRQRPEEGLTMLGLQHELASARSRPARQRTGPRSS